MPVAKPIATNEMTRTQLQKQARGQDSDAGRHSKVLYTKTSRRNSEGITTYSQRGSG
jgi:hypothetical protein